MENISRQFKTMHLANLDELSTLTSSFHAMQLGKPSSIPETEKISVERFVYAAATEINMLRHQNNKLQHQILQLKKMMSLNPVQNHKIPFWVR
jgi:hypothetical protein